MAISYNGLWKQLIDHGMKKGDLCAKTGLSSSTIAKMTNCESVKLSVLKKSAKSWIVTLEIWLTMYRMKKKSKLPYGGKCKWLREAQK